MKKVLFVATVVKMHINAFHLPYIKWLKEEGYEVHVCARNDFDIKSDCYIPYADLYIDLPFERNPLHPSNIQTYSKLSSLINSNEYDLIHCHTPTGGLLARLAARKNRRKGNKVMYTAHGFHFFKNAPLKNWLLFYPIEKFLSRYTDTLITINDEDYQLSKRFHAKKNTLIEGIGVDLDKYTNSIDVSEKKSLLEIDPNKKIILSVGEISVRKNHRVIIEALSKIDSSNIIYLIVGQGSLKSELMELSDAYKLDVRFLGFRTDVNELMHISDLFVFPSLQEGLPVSLMEAMAAGLPIICSDIRGNNDLIINDKGGYLVKPSDSDAFADNIEKMLSRSDASFGYYNKKRVEDYSLEKVLQKMMSLYKIDLNG